MVELDVLSASPEDSLRLAARLGTLLGGGEVLALVGELGAGKTTFTRGLARGLGCVQADSVTSPTFVLEQVYEGRLSLHHYDAYRLGSEDELRTTGFDEIAGMAGSVVVVEWADRVPSALPPASLLVELDFVGSPAGSERRIRFSGPESVWGRVLNTLSKNE